MKNINYLPDMPALAKALRGRSETRGRAVQGSRDVQVTA